MGPQSPITQTAVLHAIRLMLQEQISSHKKTKGQCLPPGQHSQHVRLSATALIQPYMHLNLTTAHRPCVLLRMTNKRIKFKMITFKMSNSPKILIAVFILVER